MVLYIGKNFFEEAVAAKRKLLAKCLITVPQYIDQLECYPHTGKLPDDVYRKPWIGVEADNQLLKNESGNIFLDALTLVGDETISINTIGHEQFFSYEETELMVDETANFHLECDMVPSSNPSSADTFTANELLEKECIFQETFFIEDLKPYISDLSCLKIEELLYNSGHKNVQNSLPNLSSLLKSLSLFTVIDSLFVEKEKLAKAFREENIPFANTLVDCANQQDETVTEYFSEMFKKVVIPDDVLFGHCKELEDVVTDDTISTESCHKISDLLQSLVLPRTAIPMDDDVASWDLILGNRAYSQQIERYECSPRSPVSSFLDINEIIISEQDRHIENAILASPVSNPSLEIIGGDLKHVHRLPVDLNQTERSKLLEEKDKNVILQKLWQLHKYCDEIQASRLPEPIILKFNDNKADNLVQETMQLLKISTDMKTGSLDLLLPWDIVKLGTVMTDPCKRLAPIEIEPADGTEAVRDVETIHKYNAAEMGDWQDPEIIVGNKAEIDELPVVLFNDKQKAVPRRHIGNKCDYDIQVMAGSDPLVDFIALRSKASKWSNNTTTASRKKLDEVPAENEVINNEQTKIPKLKRNEMAKKVVKHYVVNVKLSDEFKKIIEMLKEASWTFIHALKQSESISQSSSFTSITPDMSHFLLKQREKYLLDNNQEVTTDDIYKNIVAVHGLKEAADIVAHCCLESAIGYLSAYEEKYKALLGNYLDGIRQKLFMLKVSFYQKKLYHPKIVSLCRELETWLKKKRTKFRDDEQKMLVLLKKDMPSLLNCIKIALGLGNLINPDILISADSESIIQSLDHYNCLIAHQSLITDSFPWAQFCVVVDYDWQEGSQWQLLCERQHIRHIALQVSLEDEQCIQVNNHEWTSTFLDKEICLIGSQRVTRNTELLHLLESRYNILLIERDYSKIKGCRNFHFSDIDVDENTGIVMDDLKELGNAGVVQDLVTKMAALSLKYTSCWFILYDTVKTGSYQFPDHIINNISRLQATVSNFIMKCNGFYAKVVFCNSMHELAFLIRNISESCLTANGTRVDNDWQNRKWLTDEITQQEKFLIMLPCLSSFSAQLLLKNLSIAALFSLSLPEMMSYFPRMPTKVISMLIRLANNINGLQLQDKDNDLSSKNFSYTSPSHMHEEITENVPNAVKIDDSQEQGSTSYYKVCDAHMPEDCQTIQTDSNSCSRDTEHKQIICNKHEYFIGSKFEGNLFNQHASSSICNVTNGNQFNKETAMHQCTNYIPHTTDVTEKQGKNERNTTDVTLQTIAHPRIENYQVPLQRAVYSANKKLISDTPIKFNNKECFENLNRIDTFIAKKWDGKDDDWDETYPDFERSEFMYADTPNTLQQKNLPISKSTAGIFSGSFAMKYQKDNKSDDGSYYFQLPEFSNKRNFNESAVSNKLDMNISSSSGKSRPTITEMDRCVPRKLPANCVKNLRDNDSITMSPSYKYGTVQQQFSAENQAFLLNDNWNPTINQNYGYDLEEVNNKVEQKLPICSNNRKEYNQSTNKLEKQFLPAEGRSVYKSTRIGSCDQPFHEAYGLYQNNKISHKVGNKSDCAELMSFAGAAMNSSHFPESGNNTSYHSVQHMYGPDVNISCQRKKTSKQTPLENNEPSFLDISGICHSQSALQHDSDLYQLPKNCRDFQFNLNVPENFLSGPSLSTAVNQAAVNRHIDDAYPGINSKSAKDVFQDADELFINPNLDRITLKPVCVNNQLNITNSCYKRTLDDELRETARKCIANSQQFSRFTQANRNPLQKVNIGLAQPHLRQKEDECLVPKIAEADSILMNESPWATENSPPMDLKYDNSQINSVLYPNNNGINKETSKKELFTSQTPNKKRRLSYQRLPGKKGQTRLVFE